MATYQAINACTWRNGSWIAGVTDYVRQGFMPQPIIMKMLVPCYLTLQVFEIPMQTIILPLPVFVLLG